MALATNGNKPVPMISQPRELTPEAILHYIDQHYAKPLTPHDVASELHYSLGHLTHLARRTRLRPRQ